MMWPLTRSGTASCRPAIDYPARRFGSIIEDTDNLTLWMRARHLCAAMWQRHDEAMPTSLERSAIDPLAWVARPAGYGL